MATRAPAGLGRGGRALWRGVVEHHDLDPVQEVNLLEACRLKDRCDKLDELLRGKVEVWAKLTHRTQTDDYELVVDKAFASAIAASNQMKQHLAALRLPDALGDKPQQRGGARGAYVPGGAAAQPASPVPDEVAGMRARLSGFG